MLDSTNRGGERRKTLKKILHDKFFLARELSRQNGSRLWGDKKGRRAGKEKVPEVQKTGH